MNRADSYFGGKMFPNIMMEFLQLDSDLRPLYVDDQPVLYRIQEVEGFFEKIGKNTNYVVHPEEIMAVNFSMAIAKQPDTPNPEILAAVLAVLSREQSKRE